MADDVYAVAANRLANESATDPPAPAWIVTRLADAEEERDRCRARLVLVRDALNEIDDEVTEACGLGSHPSRTIGFQLMRIRETLNA